MIHKKIIWIFCDIACLVLALLYTNFSAWTNWYRMQAYNVIIPYLLNSGYLIFMYTLLAISVCIAFPVIRQKKATIIYLDAGIRVGIPIIVMIIVAIKKGTFAILPQELIGLLVISLVQYAEAFWRKALNRKNQRN